MNTLIERLILWWADRQMTPEQMAARALERQGLQGSLHPTYRHLFTDSTGPTRGLALTGRALAWRTRN